MMKKFAFLMVLACMVSTGKAQVVNGDLNEDGDLSVGDVTILVDDVLKDNKRIIDPLMIDNSKIVGTWYVTESETLSFNEDGTTNYKNGATYKYQPLMSRVLIYDSKGKMIDVLNIYEVSDKFISFSKLNDNNIHQYGASQELTSGLVSTFNGHEYVDLGLSVKWATVNVGASSPEVTGDLYAWGETETKDTYTLSNYKYAKSEKAMNKYVTLNLNNGSVMDYLYYLEAEDDAATVKWGAGWRSPSAIECGELFDTKKCSNTWVSNYNGSGIDGVVVTSKMPGYEGNSIFIPAGTHWMRQSGTYTATVMIIKQDSYTTGNGMNRYNGYAIRPVHK